MIPFCCCVSSFVSHFLPVIKNSYSMFSFVFFMSSDIFSDIFLQIFYLHSSRQSRIKVSACATACPLILLRFPVKWYSRVTVLPLQQHPINTVPTGVSSVPPPGPARPVTERQMSVPAALQPPFAISFAHFAETAPTVFKVLFFTPRHFLFAGLV